MYEADVVPKQEYGTIVVVSTKPVGKDEENSSVRSPLEILKDTFADKDLSENLSKDMQNILRAKAVNLKEVSPSCNCAALGLAGECHTYPLAFSYQNEHITFLFYLSK